MLLEDELFVPGTIGVDDNAGGTLRRWSTLSQERFAGRTLTSCFPASLGRSLSERGRQGCTCVKFVPQNRTEDRQSGSYVSVVTTVGDRDEASLERTAEEEAALESDEGTAVVEKGAELPACERRARNMLKNSQTSSS